MTSQGNPPMGVLKHFSFKIKLFKPFCTVRTTNSRYLVVLQNYLVTFFIITLRNVCVGRYITDTEISRMINNNVFYLFA